MQNSIGLNDSNIYSRPNELFSGLIADSIVLFSLTGELSIKVLMLVGGRKKFCLTDSAGYVMALASISAGRCASERLCLAKISVSIFGELASDELVLGFLD